ncbi:NAD(P)H-dependent oxidoreductase [Flavobacteriaceae bacterium 3-367]
MITIVSGSNRKDNKTVHFARYVHRQLLKEAGTTVHFLDLSGLEGNLITETMYKDQPQTIQHIQDHYFIPSTKFWFFIPEYNGSYPGILKLILDAISVREYDKSFVDKRACITGIASGRAGNLRGMDHLAEVLNHLGMHVHPNKNPISSIYKLLDAENSLVDKDAEASLQKQMRQFLNF